LEGAGLSQDEEKKGAVTEKDMRTATRGWGGYDGQDPQKRGDRDLASGKAKAHEQKKVEGRGVKGMIWKKLVGKVVQHWE